MKKIFLVLVMFMAVMSLFAPTTVLATDSNKAKTTAKSNVNISTDNYEQPQNCDSLLGSTSDENSVAWLVQKILNYIQILGPILVVILSSIDFAKVIITGDDDAMAKATKKLTTRLVLAASLFFLPILVSVLLNTFGVTTDATCGLK